jgi:hypothetical protein
MAVSSIKTTLKVAFLSMLAFSACKKDLSKTSSLNQVAETSKASGHNESGGVLVESICFKAIALVAGCKEGVTENIEFTGIIENRVKATQANGSTNYIRHFTVKGLTGRGTMGTSLAPTSAPLCSRMASSYTGTQYEVVGGAEMFSIHYSGAGAIPVATGSNVNVYIHQGTLVFVNTTTGERIVARHIIRRVPGQDGLVSMWTCGGGGMDGGSH